LPAFAADGFNVPATDHRPNNRATEASKTEQAARIKKTGKGAFWKKVLLLDPCSLHR
jgi:hypothetical protein